MSQHTITIPLLLCVTLLNLSACKTISHGDTDLFALQSEAVSSHSKYEDPGFLPTKQFLSDSCSADCTYELHPQTYNNGFSNSYKVTYKDHLFVVQGTDAAIELLKEIKAVSAMEKVDVVKIVGNTVWHRTRRLAATPYEIGASLVERVHKVESVSDAVLFLPTAGFDISANLINGAKELGVTAVRLTDNLSQTSCKGLKCAKGTVEDLWYGVNALTGKHKAARDLHKEHGTDPETQNPLLKREIDRHAYTSSVSNTAFKYGLGATQVPAIADTSSAIGYYRNIAYLGRYEDSRKQETADKQRLKNWGIPTKMIGSFYGNSAFTRTLRRSLIQSFSDLEGVMDVTQTLSELTKVKTRHQAHRLTIIYEYVAQQETVADISSLSAFTQGVSIHRQNGDRIHVIKADHLTWSKDLAETLYTSEADKESSHQIELRVLGPVSETVKTKSRIHGFRLVSE